MLFVACMLCHGELAARKPRKEASTYYFLMVAIGGALGGLFTAVVAPNLSPQNWEWILGTTGLMAAAVAALAASLKARLPVRKPLFTAAAVVALLCGVGAVGKLHALAADHARIAADRSFYGNVAVLEIGGADGKPVYRAMRSGSVLHGVQLVVDGFRDKPTGYYGATSGIGALLTEAARVERPVRVGVIGLGVGTLAVYGRNGDYYDFYELNPAVDRFAREYFTFLRDSKAECRVILGDARTMLERARTDRSTAEAAALRYDVLVLDAFTSDAIPMHLLTAEAFETYLAMLRDDGIIAIHISNSHLDLVPVLVEAAERFELESSQRVSRGNPAAFTQGARWVLLTRRPVGSLWTQTTRRDFGPLKSPLSIRLWTDDDNSLFDILR
jgi:hypothetical protein